MAKKSADQLKAIFASMSIPKKVTFYDPRARAKVDIDKDSIEIKFAKNGKPMYVGQTKAGHLVYQFAPMPKTTSSK